MSEEEWLAATDPRPMLRFASSHGQLRHFAVACVRALGVGERPSRGEWYGVSDLWPEVLDLADRLASGLATSDEITTLDRELRRRVGGMTLGKDRSREVGYRFQFQLLQESFTQQDAAHVLLYGLYGWRVSVWAADRAMPLQDIMDYLPPGESLEQYWPVEAIQRRAERMARQAALARDIIGNPFRPVSLDPSWLTSNVLALAQGIYADYAFDRLPILADALMDGECTQEDILSHCRSDGPHVRGCWVVEYLLGRSAPAGGRLLRLVGMTDRYVGQRWTFSEPFEVGRTKGRFLADDQDTSLSRRHAAVFHNPAGWWVADRGSTNGTWLNGTRLDGHPAGPLRGGRHSPVRNRDPLGRVRSTGCRFRSARPAGRCEHACVGGTEMTCMLCSGQRQFQAW